jgi:hypothetical protein
VNFARIVEAFCEAQVEFIIIGGWSAILHGSSHVTNDIDFFLSRTPENIQRVVNALSPYHPRPRNLPAGLPFVWDEESLGNMAVIRLTTQLGAIDLLFEVTGLGAFMDSKDKAVQVEAFGQRAWTLDLESLIRSKRASGRPKDLAILPELESLLEADGS